MDTCQCCSLRPYMHLDLQEVIWCTSSHVRLTSPRGWVKLGQNAKATIDDQISRLNSVNYGPEPFFCLFFRRMADYMAASS
ncbi:hypothetical protein MAR_029094 [Mya arenaria]|uniref:Uncharacterized protein n=1 Tax=Mya arenaria TaxID=6604 RepID=A0ABY7DFD9_MYAAR|nr:hypothetical protein MAR_029094 [Mya arenaria]